MIKTQFSTYVWWISDSILV